MSRVKRFTFHPQGAEHIELFRAGRIKGTIHLIYWRPFDLQRHRQAPLLREREEFLLDLLKQGSGRIPVQNVGTMLLRAIEATNIKTLLPLGDGDISRIAQKIWGNRVLSDSKKPGHNSAHMLRFVCASFCASTPNSRFRSLRINPSFKNSTGSPNTIAAEACCPTRSSPIGKKRRRF
jgi:hypothetical protein